MARLHSETTSTLAATARVMDGFVTTQSDHQGITESFTRAYTAAGNSTATVYDAAFDQPSVITNAQGKTSCYKYDLRGRKVAEWGTVIQSPRRLVGGLDKCAAFAPKGRAADGAAASQPIRWSSEYNDSELGLVCYNDRHDNPEDGRWMGRDPLAEIRQSEKGQRCLYGHHVCTTMP